MFISSMKCYLKHLKTLSLAEDLRCSLSTFIHILYIAYSIKQLRVHWTYFKLSGDIKICHFKWNQVIVGSVRVFLCTSYLRFVWLLSRQWCECSDNLTRLVSFWNSGTKGAQGLQGPTGLQGPAGSQGPTGSAGQAGATGFIGSSGQQGATGASGAPGATGFAGPTGNPGQQGQQGSSGPRGDTGATGQIGTPGQQGLQGDTGSSGDTGATGDVGQVGSPGTDMSDIFVRCRWTNSFVSGIVKVWWNHNKLEEGDLFHWS
jgi:hypothetical protein